MQTDQADQPARNEQSEEPNNEIKILTRHILELNESIRYMQLLLEEITVSTLPEPLPSQEGSEDQLEEAPKKTRHKRVIH